MWLKLINAWAFLNYGGREPGLPLKVYAYGYLVNCMIFLVSSICAYTSISSTMTSSGLSDQKASNAL